MGEIYLVLGWWAAPPDISGVTLISLLERVTLPPRCDLCTEVATASTSRGPRCVGHAVEEAKADAADGRADWIPRVLRRRQGSHAS